MKRYFYFANHQNKGEAYINALTSAGYVQRSDISQKCDLAFFDHDIGINGNGFRQDLLQLYGRDVPIFFYPHAARPMIQWDMYDHFPHAICNFVISKGHQEVMKRIGYSVKTEVAGWSLCPIKEFEPKPIRNRKIKVLFAPIHPNANGWEHAMDKQKNSSVFHQLLELKDITLTVRHINRMDMSGLWKQSGVLYIQGEKVVGSGLNHLREYDLIVAHQTFAYLAAASGKPVLMFGDDLIPHSGNRPEHLRLAKNPRKYMEYMAYPLNIEDAMNASELSKMMHNATEEDIVVDWKKRFIGKPFDAESFIKKLEKYLDNEEQHEQTGITERV